MNLDQVIEKCKEDLDDIMSSIQSVKGQDYVEILTLHINFCTLVTLTGMLEDEDIDPQLVKMLRKTAILCASASLKKLTEMAGYTNKDCDELINWGERLQKMIEGNFKLRKEDE